MDGNNNKVCEVCGSGNSHCGRCGNFCGFGGYHIVRWILGMLIIIWIFSIGMKFGEIKTQLKGYYGYGHKSMMYGNMGWSGVDRDVIFTQALPASGMMQISR